MAEQLQTATGPSIRPDRSFTPDRSHVSPVTTREELIYLLSRACELEHGLACIYLFAAHSLKSDIAEGGMTQEQVPMVRRWRAHLARVAVEEMLHLAQASNLLTAIGGAPNFRRTNFPLPPSAFPFGLSLTLEPFSTLTIERFVTYELPEPGILSPEDQAVCDAVRARVIAAQGVYAAGRLDIEDVRGLEPFEIDFT
ncbi:MAG TPA: ferritin-like domain-containing protein, partial [Actinomycetota bacterium]|nr:ferritin-like domain-containing protein [Actinomycetota bacterium]